MAQFSKNDKNQVKIDRLDAVINAIVALPRYGFVRGSWFDVQGGVHFQFYKSMKSNRHGQGAWVSDKIVNTAASVEDLMEIVIDRL